MVRFRTFHAPGLNQIRTEVESLVDEFLGGTRSGRSYSVPALNFWEQEQELIVEAELPGYRQEDLEISVIGKELTLKGNRPESADPTVTVHRRERAGGEFTRVVTLPVDIDADKVQATLRDGVLRVVLPKAEAAKPKKVNISTT